MATDNKSFETPCICFHLRRASRAVSQFYDARFKPLGLSGAQYGLMVCISRLDGACIGDLSEAMGLEQSTVTRNVELLAAKKLVAVETDPDDARRRRLALTGEGREKLHQAAPRWREAQQEMESRLGDKGVTQLLSLLEQVESLDSTPNRRQHR